MLQPREDQAPVRTPSRSRAAYGRPRHPHVSAGGACPSQRRVKAGRTPAGFRFNRASRPGGLGHSTCFHGRKRTPASTGQLVTPPIRVEANDEGKAFVINTCNAQHPSAGRPASRCWVLRAPRPGACRPVLIPCLSFLGSRAGKKLLLGSINYVNIPSTALCPQRVAAAFPIGGERKYVVQKYNKCQERSERPKPHACGSGCQPPLRVKWRFDKRGADPEPVPSSIWCGQEHTFSWERGSKGTTWTRAECMPARPPTPCSQGADRGAAVPRPTL